MKTKHMSIFAAADNDAGFVQAVISATDFPSFSAMGFVDTVDQLEFVPEKTASTQKRKNKGSPEE
jgi:hypothetical protein